MADPEKSLTRDDPGKSLTRDAVRVLLVDDEAPFIDALAKVLRRRGYLVETNYNGPAALARIAQEPVDVMLLDVKMQGMDGLAVLREVKRIAPAIAVVLMTGHLSCDDEAAALRAGAFAYVFKPHPIDQLVELIKSAQQRPRDPA